VTDHNLHEEGYSDEFAPAVPFVSALSGIIGAAETMKALRGLSAPLHHQFDFRTMHGRRLHLSRSPESNAPGKRDVMRLGGRIPRQPP
jgi:hypothetical protein